jgi:hypothetical protein
VQPPRAHCFAGGVHCGPRALPCVQIDTNSAFLTRIRETPDAVGVCTVFASMAAQFDA